MGWSNLGWLLAEEKEDEESESQDEFTFKHPGVNRQPHPEIDLF